MAATLSISRAAATALHPVNLPEDASLVTHDKSSITWPAQAGDHKSTTVIRNEDIILVLEISGGDTGYLILTLSQQQQDDDEAPPFRLSSYQASQLPQDLLAQHLLTSLPESLDTAAIEVVVSVRSGTGLSRAFHDSVLQPLLGILGFQQQQQQQQAQSGKGEIKSYGVTITESADTVKEFARRRWGTASNNNKGAETVILLSGDGGVVDMLNEININGATTTLLPTIALMPLGTGNALFHSLHKPHYSSSSSSSSSSPLVLALRALLLHGTPHPLPTFDATFPPGSRLTTTSTPVASLTGAIVASHGFHAQLVWESDTPAWRAHGAARFGMVARALLAEAHAYRAVVEAAAAAAPSVGTGTTNNAVKRGDALFGYVLATMVSSLERTFTISPASEPLDGTLWLVHFGAVGADRMMEIMTAAYDGGRHVGMRWTNGEGGEEDGVGYEAVEEVRVTTLEEDARWRKVCIDGTIVEMPKGGSMVVRKSARPRLRVLVLGA